MVEEEVRIGLLLGEGGRERASEKATRGKFLGSAARIRF